MNTPNNIMAPEERYTAARRVTMISVWINLGLSIIKIIIGIVGRSAVLVADGIHSLSDLVSDFVVLVALRWAKAPPDREYPYGHGKFETLATLFLAVGLLGVALGIGLKAIHGIQTNAALSPPENIALLAALVSILSKEWLYHFTLRVGRRFQVPALIANAWHHRSDAISSVAALVGIGAAILGFPIMDPLMAIMVAAIIAKMGWDFFIGALRELTERAIDEPTLEKMAHLISTTPGVCSFHGLRGRRAGPAILSDCHVVVDPFLTVSEGHQIAHQVEHRLMNDIPGLDNAVVHVDIRAKTGEATQRPPPVDRDTLWHQSDTLLKTFPELASVHTLATHQTPQGIVVEINVNANTHEPLPRLRQAATRFRNRLMAALPIHEVVIRMALSGREPKALHPPT
jgi:cation diffusion facilitator family transporter